MNKSYGGISKPRGNNPVRGGFSSRGRGGNNAVDDGRQSFSFRENYRQRLLAAWGNLLFNVVSADDSTKKEKLQQMLADDNWSRAVVYFESINECVKLFGEMDSKEQPIDVITFRKSDDENALAATHFSETPRVSVFLFYFST